MRTEAIMALSSTAALAAVGALADALIAATVSIAALHQTVRHRGLVRP